MKLTPKAGPGILQPPGASSRGANEARTAAVEIMKKGLAGPSEQPHPVDPNNVSMEDLRSLSRQPQAPQLNEEQEPSSEQQDTIEATSEDTPQEEVKAKEPPLSHQHAILARKERALRDQVKRFQAEKAAFESERSKVSQTPSFDESKYIPRDRLMQDTLSVLAEAGISYDELTNQLINQANNPVNPQVSAEIKALRAELQATKSAQEEARKAISEQEKQRYDQAVKQLKRDAKQFISTSDEFELCRATNSENDVAELIESTFKETGEIISMEEAAREVEAYLEEETSRLLQVSKIKNKFGQSASQAPAQAKQPNQQTQPQLKTLTNSVSTGRKLTALERAKMIARGEKI